MKLIDCRGLECPKPVINTKKALESSNGEDLEIIVDNEVAKENVSKFLSGQGISYSLNKKGEEYVIITGASEVEKIASEDKVVKNLGDEVILFSKEVFGTGDDKLGDALMKSFMFALSESKLPKAMIFVNGGVKLTTEGSDVLETIKGLEAKGVDILSCGTCLDFYGLKDKLKVGSITNMYTIIEYLQGSGKVINL